METCCSTIHLFSKCFLVPLNKWWSQKSEDWLYDPIFHHENYQAIAIIHINPYPRQFSQQISQSFLNLFIKHLSNTSQIPWFSDDFNIKINGWDVNKKKLNKSRWFVWKCTKKFVVQHRKMLNKNCHISTMISTVTVKMPSMLEEVYNNM